MPYQVNVVTEYFCLTIFHTRRPLGGVSNVRFATCQYGKMVDSRRFAWGILVYLAFDVSFGTRKWSNFRILSGT